MPVLSVLWQKMTGSRWQGRGGPCDWNPFGQTGRHNGIQLPSGADCMALAVIPKRNNGPDAADALGGYSKIEYRLTRAVPCYNISIKNRD